MSLLSITFLQRGLTIVDRGSTYSAICLSSFHSCFCLACSAMDSLGASGTENSGFSNRHQTFPLLLSNSSTHILTPTGGTTNTQQPFYTNTSTADINSSTSSWLYPTEISKAESGSTFSTSTESARPSTIVLGTGGTSVSQTYSTTISASQTNHTSVPPTSIGKGISASSSTMSNEGHNITASASPTSSTTGNWTITASILPTADTSLRSSSLFSHSTWTKDCMYVHYLLERLD